MYTINDPLFALILRFVGCDLGVAFSNREFIRKELQAIQEYIRKFPEAEQEQHAMEWVLQHAMEYRRVWEKEVVTRRFADRRCPDCPLAGGDHLRHCQIHDQWEVLLRQYIDGKINATRYVEDALELLSQHKEHLKVKLSALER